MMLSRREVAVWNFFSMIGLGCASPPSDDAASGEESESTGSVITDTSTTPECSDHPDCAGKGGYCAPDGTCRDYCDEGGCEEEGVECSIDEDCLTQEHCVSGMCLPTSDPEPCRDIAMPSEVIELQLTEPQPATSLAFADLWATPGNELVVARGDALLVAANGTAPVAVMNDAPIGSFVAGDVDEDGTLDLVIADAEGVSTWIGDGSSFTATEVVQPIAAVQSLVVADVRIGDAVVHSVLALSGGEIQALPIDAGGVLGPPQPLFESGATGVTALATVTGAPSPTLYLAIDAQLLVTDGSTLPFAGQIGGLALEPSRLEIADFTGDGELDVIATGTAAAFSIAVNVQPMGAMNDLFGHAVPTSARAAAPGDFDGDGIADLALTREGSDSVILAFGGPALTELGVVDPFTCELEIATDFGGHALAGGDIDGDGDAELAVADDERVLVVHW